jgi:uncharacterized protein YwqG
MAALNEEIAGIARDHGLARVADAIGRAALPAVHLARTGTAPIPYSTRLGGLPETPAGFAWPRWKHRPLGFLAQIRCEEVTTADTSGLLPRTGMLYFFYDLVDQPWGFDPTERGFAAVLYADGAVPLAATAMPESGGTLEVLKPVALQPRTVATVPAPRTQAFDALGLTDDELDRYQAFQEAVAARDPQSTPRHQMLGHSWNVQGDMQLEAQLVTHGLYCGDEVAYRSPRRFELEPGAAAWRLLLQVDSDDDLGTMWGDGGLIYFWLRESDLRVRKFGESWTILQCS